MQRIADRIYFSATDLTRFADCQHLTWLDRLNLDEPMEKTPNDDYASLIQAKGIAHEEGFLCKLQSDHLDVVTVNVKGRRYLRKRSTLAFPVIPAQAKRSCATW